MLRKNCKLIVRIEMNPMSFNFLMKRENPELYIGLCLINLRIF